MMDELLEQFLIEARDLIVQAHDDLAALALVPADRERIDSAFRAVHTLKGSVAIFDMAPALQALHAAEDVLDKARSGSAMLDADRLAALVDTIDQSDRWVEAMEGQGALPVSAQDEAARLVVRLAGGGAVAAVPDGPAPDWALALTGALAGPASGPLVAFRYDPDPDCFFRGDDPVAIAVAVPDLVQFAIAPRESWPAAEAIEPFRCNLRLTGLSAAAIDAVRASFRLVSDQVAIVAVETAGAAPRAEAADAPAAAARTLRVDAVRVDALADAVGELVVAGHALAQVAARADRIDAGLAAQIRAVQSNFDRVVGDMRDAVTAVRMVSIAPVLRRLPRMVREIAAATGREVSLRITGEATQIDKGIADELFEPLLHLVRNAIDHGIEPQADRLSAGKPAHGLIRLDIARSGDQVRITLADDGKGIDPAHIRRVAVDREVIGAEAAAALDDEAALRLIFAAGFSTAAAVTDVSGRGVGMDAVQSAVDRMGGRIDLASEPGAGTTVRLILPLHAITTKLLVVEVGRDRFGVPLDDIVETSSIDQAAIFAIGRGRACVHRDRTLPLLSLARLLDHDAADIAEPKLLVMGQGVDAVGVTVSALRERIDAAVRPPRGLLAHVPGIAGTTLLGDGGVLLVLDLPGLAA
jgi:two-component system chemotaxis sensor kinase CheA